MSSPDELLQKQMQLMHSIERALANFKKMGQAKMTAATTKNRMTMLKEAFNQSQDLDARIAAISDVKTRAALPYFTEDQFIQTEERYQEAMDYMAEILAKVTPPSEPANSIVSVSNSTASRSTVHLPRIPLPSFDGTFEFWESFRDRFTSMVINNNTLSNVERLEFLCSSLTGDALRAVSHLPITENNFKVAWQITTSRYENKRRLISTHLNSLFSIPAVMSEGSTDLRSLRDKINIPIEMLRNLNRPVDMWSDVIVFLGVQKLDRNTRKAWELNLGDTTDFPSYQEFDAFLEKRIRALEAIPSNKREQSLDAEKFKSVKPKTLAHHSSTTAKFVCHVCKGDHLLYQCSKFLAKSPHDRYQIIKQQNRCVNCFSTKHATAQCLNSHQCKECKQRHHTLLHFPNQKESALPAPVPSNSVPHPEAEITSNLASNASLKSTVLLCTAQVRVCSQQGRCVNARALLDQGSAGTLITEHLAQALRLQRARQDTHILGIGENRSHASYVAAVIVTPANANVPAYSTTAIIMKSLTRYVPSRQSANLNWHHISGLDLADKDPMSSEPIDLIIGADLYGQMLLPGLRQGTTGTPTAQKTTMGWILSGPILASPADSTHIHHVSILDRLDNTLTRFWEVEDIPSPIVSTPEDLECEEHFKTTHSRTSDGRFVVRLPFKSDVPCELGESRSAALGNLRSFETRFSRNNIEAVNLYREFMSEYLLLGHMSSVDPTSSESLTRYYIPHHAVVRDTSSTTRLRVVFNASRRSSNGKSLNNLLMTGPKLQQDLVSILLRWRQFQYVYTADIAKMYRQVLIDHRDRDFQRILWRNSPTDPIAEYQLNTVTYGTTPAPYLALRVLKQLLEDDGAEFPAAHSVLTEQVYVDDFLFGGDCISLVRRMRNETVALLSKGGFTLRKWASNDPSLLSDIDQEDHGLAMSKSFDITDSLSILGLIWHPTSDQFQFRVSTLQPSPSTKRTIASAIAKIFDPLGWIAPVVITAKILLQRLWSLQIDWDDVVPDPVLTEWRNFYTQLPTLEHLSVNRKTIPTVAVSQTLHGFSDASTSAYAAAVYLRSTLSDGSVSVALIIAKSRVAPLKTISVPRLELCAALLLAQLMQFTKTALNLQSAECHCWTDSSITLAWINQSPSRWKTFVANRVAKIQNLVPVTQWHHVSSTDNPADSASRGIQVSQIMCYPLWWSGPSWLQESSDCWPGEGQAIIPHTLQEAKPERIQCLVSVRHWDLSTRFSSWPKLIRVTAFIIRFVKNAQRRRDTGKTAESTELPSLVLTPEEINHAKIFWLKQLQLDVFPEELTLLSASKPLPKSSPILSLFPYVDSNGLMRAKGRLAKSQLPGTAKTPIILRSHPLLSLLIRHTHLQLLHAGPQLTLTRLRSEYWILRPRATIRAVLYQCVECTRERATIPHELMGDLPASRVTRTERPFVNTGVDYAGPIQIKLASGRGHKTHKAYIAVFICLTVKAVHVELVNEYSTAAFVAAYKRFVSRRGIPTAIFSDNGTTFQGASRELASAFRSVVSAADFQNFLASDGVKWHFTPPNAPHFGGLWEASVKSVKYHLKRSIGSHTLTYEEMITFLCQVEACLNSRPLGAVSDCLDDYQALTPGHFLIGTSLVASPEPSVFDVRDNRLTRWQTIQKMTETFWKMWSHDYLHTLHQRPKWKTVQNLAKIGQLVLLRNPNLPPSKWELGRITACHKGDDELVRVVTVKTAHSEYKRPIARVCFLPVAINNNANDETTPRTSPHP